MTTPWWKKISLAILVMLLGVSCSSENSNSTARHDADWRSAMKEIRIGHSSSLEDPAVMARWELFTTYLEEVTGKPVKVYQSTDYNGTIQAMASGQIDIGSMGGGAYANVNAQIGELVEPLFQRRDSADRRGYYSTIVVQQDSEYQTIEDLEGARLAFVDFNSTSGYIYPRWAMRQQGINPDTFFGKTGIGGGHLQTTMALANGQFDAVVTLANGGDPEVGFASGSLRRLARRGIIDMDDYREIWFAGPLPNSSYIIRSDRSQEFRDLIRGAMLALPYDHPQAFYQTGRLPGTSYTVSPRSFYEDLFKMRDEEIKEHRRNMMQAQRSN
ncbi:MAG: phosphate/phosphite/phosphonate ABC transporter substrate-binding protein [Pseudomonadota bacterium]